jgi:hypothetical protein
MRKPALLLKVTKWAIFYCLVAIAHREWTHQSWNDFLTLKHLLTDLLVIVATYSFLESLPRVYRSLAEDIASRTALKLDRLQRGEIEYQELQEEIEWFGRPANNARSVKYGADRKTSLPHSFQQHG